jgi:ectoine hydroxylase-related dioxygenase (phytanoyl-CoA dioxygenase family)
MIWQESLEQSGFALLAGIFDRNELSRVIPTLDPARRTRAGVRHLLSDESVAALANDNRLIAIAGQVLGDDAVPFRATLFDKSPGSNWGVAWHQDTALPLQVRKDLPGWGPWSSKAGVIYAHAPASALEKILALRIHLDDSTGENGPLRVLEGTHRMGVLPDDQISRLASEITAANCELATGGIVAMRPLIIHSSSKLSAEAPRRVLHIEYSATPFITDELELALA